MWRNLKCRWWWHLRWFRFEQWLCGMTTGHVFGEWHPLVEGDHDYGYYEVGSVRNCRRCSYGQEIGLD